MQLVIGQSVLFVRGLDVIGAPERRERPDQLVVVLERELLPRQVDQVLPLLGHVP